MKFTSIIVAFFAAAVMAAPTAEADAVAAPEPSLDELVARAEWCTACQNGKKTCCSAVA